MNDRNSKAYQHTKTKSSNDVISHAIVWIDVPVRNLERAATFYSFLLNTTLSIETVAGIRLVPFPHQDGQPSGCLYLSIVRISLQAPLRCQDHHPLILQIYALLQISALRPFCYLLFR